MDFKHRALEELRARAGALSGKSAVVGLDGFIDTIVTPVALRTGQGDAFKPIATIDEFGQRILAAAGKSTNIEFYPRMDKLGGNGPIMANALLSSGLRLTYIGALGRSTLHPVFQEMAERVEVVSVCDAAATTAVEFQDGKLMLGQMRSLDEITYERILECMGAAALEQALGGADLVALVNWTMIPNMTSILDRLVTEILPRLPPKDRVYFFDLADPEKRARSDLLLALATIERFSRHGRVALGLNLKEAQQVWSALDFDPTGSDEAALRHMAATVRKRLGLGCVVIHPKESAACATVEGTDWIPGPYSPTPLITTGAGDHFNAGFTMGLLLGLSPRSCLATGVCTSGHYVRTGKSPTLDDLQTFLANWA